MLVGGSLEIFNLAWNFQSRREILNFVNLWRASDEYLTKIPEFPWGPLFWQPQTALTDKARLKNQSQYLRIRSTRTRDRNLQFRGAVSTGISWVFSSVFSSCFSRFFLCNLVRKLPETCGENCLIPARRRKRRILSRLWLSWFLRPEYWRPRPSPKKSVHLA